MQTIPPSWPSAMTPPFAQGRLWSFAPAGAGTDSHASDIGHWLGMTPLTRCLGGQGRPPLRSNARSASAKRRGDAPQGYLFRFAPLRGHRPLRNRWECVRKTAGAAECARVMSLPPSRRCRDTSLTEGGEGFPRLRARGRIPTPVCGLARNDRLFRQPGLWVVRSKGIP